MKEKSLEFVVTYYRKGAFSAERAWHRMGFGPLNRRWSRVRIAAAAAALITVTAVASLIIRNEYSASEIPEETVVVSPPRKEPLYTVKSIDFDNASLITVVREIEKVYGVRVEGMPADSAGYRLTLHYEGNVRDLLDTINDILDTKLTLKE